MLRSILLGEQFIDTGPVSSALNAQRPLKESAERNQIGLWEISKSAQRVLKDSSKSYKDYLILKVLKESSNSADR